MKKTLLKNLHVINPCSDPAFIENAFVAISGETIESVDSSEPSGTFDEVFDLDGKVALPGMINAHHHLYSALAVGMPLPKGWQWECLCPKEIRPTLLKFCKKSGGKWILLWIVIPHKPVLNPDCWTASKPEQQRSSTIIAVPVLSKGRCLCWQKPERNLV